MRAEQTVINRPQQYQNHRLMCFIFEPVKTCLRCFYSRHKPVYVLCLRPINQPSTEGVSVNPVQLQVILRPVRLHLALNFYKQSHLNTVSTVVLVLLCSRSRRSFRLSPYISYIFIFVYSSTYMDKYYKTIYISYKDCR